MKCQTPDAKLKKEIIKWIKKKYVKNYKMSLNAKKYICKNVYDFLI